MGEDGADVSCTTSSVPDVSGCTLCGRGPRDTVHVTRRSTQDRMAESAGVVQGMPSGKNRKARAVSVDVCHSLTCKGCGNAFTSGRRRGYCMPACRKKPVYVIECKQCGKTHQAAHKSAKYCSATCAAQSKPIIVYWKLCEFCGNEFPSNPANTGRWLEVVKDAALDKDAEFCSRECSVYARSFRSPEHRWLVQQQKDAARMLRQQHEPILVAQGFVSRRGVERIRQQVRNWKNRTYKTCVECGQSVGTYNRRCRECRDKWLQQLKRENRKHRGRCRRFGGKYDPAVTFKAVSGRDGMRCQWCKRKVKRTGVAVDGQAHLDHVIPLSRGGDHTMGNVVLSCRKCNCKKSAKVLTLF